MTLSSSKKSANLLLAIFIILTLFLCIGGNGLYRYQKKAITIEKHDELAAISKLKVDQIVSWRKERLENARSIYNNQAIVTHINQYIQGIDHYVNYLTISRWMKAILEEPDYSMVTLIDPSGKIIINSNPKKTLTESGKRIIEQAELCKDVVFSDLHKDNDNYVHIDLAVPLYLNSEIKEGFSGVVFLRIDPEKFLYPMVLSWPTPSRTSEILLVRRDGDSVLYLSELRYKQHSALRLRKSMTDTHILSVKAVSGITDVLEGIDYRGIKVLGVSCPVSGSSWFVVTKVDIDEIYHPIYTFAIWIFIITFLLILIAALIIYVVWTGQLHKLERERKALQQHFEYVIKYANDIICLADLKGNIYEVNDKAVNTYGYPYKELLKLHLSQLRPVEHKDTLDQQLKLLNEKDGHIYETVHINKRGEKFPVEVSGRIMVIMGVAYIQLIIRDITERNLAVEKLSASEKFLEQRVDERTFQLQTANKELEAFSYSVSHDLRAPLCNIDGWSMVLLEHSYENLDEQGLKYLGYVRDETQRMRHLIDAMLELSRVSRTALSKVDVDLTVLAQYITNHLLKVPKDRQIDIIIQPGMVTFGDPNMLEIALTNLLDNAYKFTGKQSLTHIEVGQSVIDEKKTFWIRDNGAGFDMANAKNLFGAFQRMHTQTDFPGTGIGLATVQRIIHRHNGHIWTESKIDQGTTFFFTLPEDKE